MEAAARGGGEDGAAATRRGGWRGSGATLRAARRARATFPLERGPPTTPGAKRAFKLASRTSRNQGRHFFTFTYDNPLVSQANLVLYCI